VKQPPFLVKLAAVTSSVLIASGLIAYRAGAFDSLLGRGQASGGETLLGSSKSKQIFTEPPGTSPETLSIMYSSKSGTVLPPTDSSLQPPAGTSSSTTTTTLPSSKSITFIVPPAPKKQASQPAPASPPAPAK
jgi:hypothetical protein